jgi:hypothetical protein
MYADADPLWRSTFSITSQKPVVMQAPAASHLQGAGRAHASGMETAEQTRKTMLRYRHALLA